jgi:hypothetical protein
VIEKKGPRKGRKDIKPFLVSTDPAMEFIDDPIETPATKGAAGPRNGTATAVARDKIANRLENFDPNSASLAFFSMVALASLKAFSSLV